MKKAHDHQLVKMKRMQVVFWEMKVYEGPLSFALGNKLDHSLDVVSDFVPLIVVFYLYVAVAEEKVVMDAFFISPDCFDDVLVF